MQWRRGLAAAALIVAVLAGCGEDDPLDCQELTDPVARDQCIEETNQHFQDV